MADYACCISQRLEQAGFAPYQLWRYRSSISVSENGKTYIVDAVSPSLSAVFQIDGDVVSSGQKCDKLLVVTEGSPSPCKGVAAFIELKGKDISHAIDQLEGTIKNQLFTPYPSGKDEVRARIVTAGCGPASSSKRKLEEARVRFKCQYHIELRVLKNNQPDTPIKL